MAVQNLDFFISYNSADRRWAEWIAWQLEEAGFTTILQAWDFRPGSNFVVEMDRASRSATRTISVLSPDYLGAAFPQPEWAAAFAQDPEGIGRTLVPVRVRDCRPAGLLAQIVYVDLVGLDEEAARERLLAGIEERGKPRKPPYFPGPHLESAEPLFPGTEAPADGDAAPGPVGTWVMLNEIAFAVDELDDKGSAITIKGRLNEEISRRLDRLRELRFGTPRVRFVHGDRVVDAQFAALRRSTRGGVTETELELQRVEPARGDALRAGTTGMSADDLVESGLRHLLLGEPLPTSLGLLDSLTETGVDRTALAEAFARRDPEAEPVARLVLADGLIGHGNATAITRFELGPEEDDQRRVVLEWEEPRVYTNVEPQRRRIEGDWSGTRRSV